MTLLVNLFVLNVLVTLFVSFHFQTVVFVLSLCFEKYLIKLRLIVLRLFVHRLCTKVGVLHL